MGTFSGTSTPGFDSSFDLAFGTPQEIYSLNEKTDYFSSIPKAQPDYGFPGLFGTSPYPNQMDITPPHTARDPPPNWPFGMGSSDKSKSDPTNQPITGLNESSTKIQYGQTTPPDEAIRAPDLDDLHHGFPLQSSKANQKHTISPAYSKSPKKSKKNKNGDSNGELDKRSKFLERNRLAASKCRQKKKEYNNTLESRSKALERDNAYLKMELEKYQTEKINLMTAMAQHAPNECDCHKIHQHVASFKAQFSDPAPTTTRKQSVASAVSNTEPKEESE